MKKIGPKRKLFYIILCVGLISVFPKFSSALKLTSQAKLQENSDLMELLQPPSPQKVVALTFDDGPHPLFTPLLLDALQRYNAKATFFVVGVRAKQFPELLRRLVYADCEIANHTYSHPNFVWLSEEEMGEELLKTSEIVKLITGRKLLFFRPPGGNVDLEVKDVVSKIGFTMVMWDINTSDYVGVSSRAIKQKVLRRVRNGSIILMHDGIVNTARILPELLEELKKRGYTFVSISELMKMKKTVPKPDYEKFDRELCKRFPITKEAIVNLRRKGASPQEIIKLCELSQSSGEPVEKLIVMYHNGIAVRLIAKIVGAEP